MRTCRRERQELERSSRTSVRVRRGHISLRQAQGPAWKEMWQMSDEYRAALNDYVE